MAFEIRDVDGFGRRRGTVLHHGQAAEKAEEAVFRLCGNQRAAGGQPVCASAGGHAVVRDVVPDLRAARKADKTCSAATARDRPLRLGDKFSRAPKR